MLDPNDLKSPDALQNTAQEDCELSVRAKVPIDLCGLEHVPVTFVSFANTDNGHEHFAVVFGHPETIREPIVRVHSECITGDLFGSKRCDCGAQLQEFLQMMRGRDGILIYLRQEGRGIGLYSKLDAYLLQDEGQDTFEANKSLNLPEDGRDFKIAAQMLKLLDITRCTLVTNNPDKVTALTISGVKIAQIQQTGTHVTEQNKHYLSAKRAKGHMLDDIDPKQ